MTLLTKQCCACKQTLKTNAFNKDKTTKDGLCNRCRVCDNYKSAAVYASPEGRAKALVRGMRNNKRNGKRSTLEKTITYNDILPAILHGKCQLTGLFFDFKPPNKTSKNPYAPSLDRIDSHKGYSKENCRVVLAAVNTAINEYGDKVMLPILKAMVKAIEKNAKT